MFDSKTFRNTSTSPVLIAVTPSVDADGIVRAIYAAGGTLFNLPEMQAETERMFKWVRATFIGQHQFFFNAHNGVVPGWSETVNIVNVSGSDNPLNLSARDRRFITLTPEQMQETLQRHVAASLGLDYDEFLRDVRKTEDKTAHADILRNTKPEASHEHYEVTPNVGTYWRDRNRPLRYFYLVSKHECGGHTHMRMLRVDNARGGEYDFVYADPRQWAREFQHVTRDAVPGDPDTSRTVVFVDKGEVMVSFDGNDTIPAGDLTNEQVRAVVAEHGEEHPGLHDFLEGERLNAALAKQQAERMPVRVSFKSLRSRPLPGRVLGDETNAYAQLAEEFSGGAYRSARELPPAPGERYHSLISGGDYTVIDERRKHHSEDRYITMERDGDRHRAKYTYRDHVSWLTVWRPLDDVPAVDSCDKTVADCAARFTGETEVAALAPEIETRAERHLRILYRELDRKVPGWREAGDGDQVFLDDVALALRAIRSINKHMRNYEHLAVQAAAELRNVTGLETENAELKRDLKVCREKYPLPAIGSVWRNNRTGSYQTATHLYSGSEMCRMKSAKGTEFDTPVERLFQSYTLVTGPELSMQALGDFRCNAYGMYTKERMLREFVDNNVLNVTAYSMSSDGQINVQGTLSTAPKA